MQEPGVMCAGLAWKKSGQFLPEMAQEPEETMKKLTPVPDVLPTTDWETGMHQGSTGAEVGANSFFHREADGLRESSGIVVSLTRAMVTFLGGVALPLVLLCGVVCLLVFWSGTPVG